MIISKEQADGLSKGDIIWVIHTLNNNDDITVARVVDKDRKSKRYGTITLKVESVDGRIIKCRDRTTNPGTLFTLDHKDTFYQHFEDAMQKIFLMEDDEDDIEKDQLKENLDSLANSVNTILNSVISLVDEKNIEKIMESIDPKIIESCNLDKLKDFIKGGLK